MAPLSSHILQSLASRDATNTMAPTLFPRQYFPVPPYTHISPPDVSTSPSENAPTDQETLSIAIFHLGLTSYICMSLILAICATSHYNNLKYPSSSTWTYLRQAVGFFALFLLASPLIGAHGCLQLLVRDFLRFIGVPINAEASETGSAIVISGLPSGSTLSTYSSFSSDSPSQVNGRRTGCSLRRALVKYVGLFPLREGKLSWPEQNHRESERWRQQNRQRTQAAHDRQADEEAARLEDELAPLPEYDGAVLPPYELESHQSFVVVPHHSHQGELHRSREGLVPASAVVGDNRDGTTRVSSHDPHDHMMYSPPPAYELVLEAVLR